MPNVMALVTYAAFHGLLYHTRFGTYIFALGGNREALKYAGLSPNRLLIAVYALGGTMAGVAGLLMTARMNSGHPTAGLGSNSTPSRQSRSAAPRSSAATRGPSAPFFALS